MLPFWIGITVAVFGAAVCVAVGAVVWLIRFGSPTRVSARATDMKHVKKTLKRLKDLKRFRELTQHVKAVVGEHVSQVQAIRDELSVADDAPLDIVNLEAKSVATFDRLQYQLPLAQEKLQQQSKQIETYFLASRTSATVECSLSDSHSSSSLASRVGENVASYRFEIRDKRWIALDGSNKIVYSATTKRQLELWLDWCENEPHSSPPSPAAIPEGARGNPKKPKPAKRDPRP